MVSGIRFFAASGAMGGTPTTRAVPLVEIFNLEEAATASPNRVGFFGVNGAPNSPVRIGQYQDRTHRCDNVGTDLGTLINVKFIGSTDADVSGVNIALTGHGLADIPQNSGTLLIRFTEPNAQLVQTQDAVFRCVGLNAASGIPGGDGGSAAAATNITVQAAQLADTDGAAGDATWTDITAMSNSSLTLNDQTAEATVHDWHVIVSASPGVAGRKVDFGFYVETEFL
jgi:hypothetical protein